LVFCYQVRENDDDEMVKIVIILQYNYGYRVVDGDGIIILVYLRTTVMANVVTYVLILCRVEMADEELHVPISLASFE
jgi:hypothetical protein